MNPYEMTQELQQAWLDFDVDLRGLTVYTEAATGPYAVTAVLAAMAGAKVYALAKDSAYGSADQAEQETRALSKSAKVDARIQFVREKKEADLAEVDVVTNCGHVRPIDAKMIESLTHPSVVIPLM